MDAFEPKKLALFRIYQILQKYSDYDHPMTQAQIAQKLEEEYGIVLERKAVSRNLSLLKEAGEDIESDARGSYLSGRVFENSELRLLIDSVLSSRFIPAKQSKELAEKLAGLSNQYFRSGVRHMHTVDEWVKSENRDLFYNIEVIGEAIERKKQISFVEYKYNEKLKLVPGFTLHPQVTPIQMMIHNQRYYLLAAWGDETDWHGTVLKLDSMRELVILEDVPALKLDAKEVSEMIDYEKLTQDSGEDLNCLDEKMVDVTFLLDGHFIDDVVRVFGKKIRIRKPALLTEEEWRAAFPAQDGDKPIDKLFARLWLREPILIDVKTTENTAVRFAKENSSRIFIFEPGYMRERVRHQYEIAARRCAQVEQVDKWNRMHSGYDKVKRPDSIKHGTGKKPGNAADEDDGDWVILDSDNEGRTVTVPKKK